MKNFKTFYETQRASHLKEIIQSPHLSPSDKSFLHLWNKKMFLREYTDICFPSTSRMQFLGV